MKTRFQKLTTILGMVALFALLSAMATAQCGNPGIKFQRPKIHRQAWMGTDNGATLQLISDDSNDPLVGMWQATWTAEGNTTIPDGTIVDQAFSHFHSDGTELQNSSRPPDTQSFCMGVWKKFSGAEYRVNHFAISWVAGDDSAPLGTAHIRQHILLSSDRNSYTGSFIIDQFDTSGNNLAHITGTLAGSRITVDTPVTQVF